MKHICFDKTLMNIFNQHDYFLSPNLNKVMILIKCHSCLCLTELLLDCVFVCWLPEALVQHPVTDMQKHQQQVLQYRGLSMRLYLFNIIIILFVTPIC